ncbi:sensor histidine kinase [Pacificimonas flava]|uniref:histidine kinase n=1 Tax=Pacificimonas flava TaxID=1234595 RepID=M2U8H9_9SPHN|nr:HAMP domain-containing sensor histidine kinase [Pacificimonas flava]EMD84288.1 Signal transduction histidine kinase [Pacificimonas flava]MBB5279836.1 signal transduction histidine kinase [Pacificimonas flava]
MLIDILIGLGSPGARRRDIVTARPRGDAVAPQSFCGTLNETLGRIEAGAAKMQSEAEAEAASRYTNYARDISTASQHLSRVLADLWRQNDAEPTPRSETFDVGEAVEEAVRLVRPLRAAKGIDIELDLASETAPDGRGSGARPRAAGDRRFVQQILLNLLSNALKFGPVGSRVRVSVESGDIVAIRVADAGPGIPLEDRHRIFEPFERLESREQGMGLGLAISSRYALAMQGRLYAEESELGGAALILELPSALSSERD